MMIPPDQPNYLLAEHSFLKVKLAEDKRPNALSYACPMEIAPAPSVESKGIVLLIHGLLGTPFLMWDLANFFIEQGWTVQILRLPGHGTQSEALLDVDFRDWLQAAEQHVERLTQRTDRFLIAGYSTGASTALHLAQSYPTVRGLILFAPALKLCHRFAWASGYLQCLSRCLRQEVWVSRRAETDPSHYRSMCLNAAWQVYRLSQATRLRCKRHTPHIPQFWVVSEHDETVSTAENVRIFNALTHPQKQLVFYGDPGRSGAKSHTQFRPCAYPEQRVLSLSHYCMATAPDNPHFGYASQYMDLAHYQPPLPVLPRHETLMFSATSHPPPEGQLYGRTSFNPDFYGLMAEIGDWLKRAF